MAAAPYQRTFRERGRLCFYAEVPALAHIGARLAELSDTQLTASAPPEELGQWRALADHLQRLVESAASGKSPAWPQIEDELQRLGGDRYELAKNRVMRPVHEFFTSGQMPLPEYLEWLLWGTENAWAQNCGSGDGPRPDNQVMQARTDRLTQRLQAGGYEAETDRRMRAEDPERYEFMSRSAELAMNALNAPDPAATDQLFDQMLELFKQSPMFAEGQQTLDNLRRQAEARRESDPELSEHQQRSAQRMQQMMVNPAAAIAEMQARLAEKSRELLTGLGSEELAGGIEDVSSEHVPGRLKFDCGECAAPGAEHIRLFDELIAAQLRLRPGIEAALREMHGWMGADGPHLTPGDRAIFPPNPAATDVPLHCFQIASVNLEAGEPPRIVLALDSLFGHFDEHGCFIAIRDGAVERYGTWDEVYGDDFADEGPGEAESWDDDWEDESDD